MRLIDAEAFNSWLEGYALGKRKISITNILEHVRDMPTIQTERKRGKWIPHNEEKEFGWGMRAKGGVECPVCGYKTYNKMHRLFGCPFNYCPMCGAIMKEW